LVRDVVPRALLWIAEDAVRLAEQTETALVACFRVVGMESLRQKSIDAVKGFGIGVRTDLKHLVVVDRRLLSHTDGPARPGPRRSDRPAHKIVLGSHKNEHELTKLGNGRPRKFGDPAR